MASDVEVSQLFRAAPDRMVEVAGGTAAAVRSIGTGPDVLFVHGWPVSGATFRRVLPLLAGRARCHVVDLPGAGSSRFGPGSPLSVDLHIRSVRRVVDELELDDVAVVGHDSGGLVARHALAGDPRVRAVGLIDTEPSPDIGWRFRSFLRGSRLPGFGPTLGWLAGHRRLRRHPLVLGGAFHDRDLLDGDFDDLFLRPLHDDRLRRDAAVRIIRSFRSSFLSELPALHRRIEVPVHLVWGEHDVFFPVADAEAMVETFPDATLSVVRGAGLFSHEERPREVAEALGRVAAR